MPRNNPVTRLLVTKNNAAVLAAGNPPSALAVGQIGIFDYDTNLSITTNTARHFYLAVGTDLTSTGAITDIAKSAGTHIQKNNITAYNLRCYTPGQAEVTDITGFTVKCDTDYGIKIGVTNGEAYANYGYNSPSKTFMVHSNCCTDDCAACPAGNCNDVALQLATAINNDVDAVMTAQLIDYTTTPGTNAVVAFGSAYTTWAAANPTKCLGVRVISTPEALKNFATINQKYDFIRGTNISVYLIEGFDCNGTVTAFQDLVYEQGSGYDVAEREYLNAGYNGQGNYRLSGMLGMPLNTVLSAQANPLTKYLTVSLHHDLKSEGDSRYYSNGLLTHICMPCPDTTTIASFLGALDTLTAAAGWEAKADDAAACPGCTTVNFTSARAVTAEGLEGGGE